jgi:hypothetical protein
MAAFNVLRSKTIWGALTAAIGFLLSPEVFAILPEKVAAVVGAIGAVLAAFGLRSAVARSGPEAPPET